MKVTIQEFTFETTCPHCTAGLSIGFFDVRYSHGGWFRASTYYAVCGNCGLGVRIPDEHLTPQVKGHAEDISSSGAW